MLKTIDLLNKVDKKYHEMLRMVNIPDFTKCIAQFAGLEIKDVPDSVIKEYLNTWAVNKYKFFLLFGNKTRVDKPISYVDIDRNIPNLLEEIGVRFPTYYFWIQGFRKMTENKIKDLYHLDWDFRYNLEKVFPYCQLSGSTITHFFKKYLEAPDELITELGRVFENQKINATYTLSIDPVDMMLASENPYNWTSCYKLKTPNDGSHADGCLAALLDTSVIISYIWNNEGDFNLYNHFLFKNIRYKRIREWIAVSENMTTLDFCSVYPGKDNYNNNFCKELRNYLETLIAEYKGVENKWKTALNATSERGYFYGYSEFQSGELYYLSSCKEDEVENITPYNVPILCPCGCGNILMGSNNEENDYCYNGDGFTCENYIERYYCEYSDDYCEVRQNSECCEECGYYLRCHPKCGLNTDRECECPDWDYRKEGNDEIMDSCSEYCEDCPIWQAYYSEE